MPVRHGGNGRHFANQPLNLQQPIRGIVHMLRIRIYRRKRRHRAHKHPHGMAVVAEALHKFLCAFMQHGVVRDFIDPVLQFGFCGQFAKKQQIGDFQKSAALRQHFDGISAITQNSPVSVDIGDAAAARRRVHERRIVGHQPKIFWPGLDLPQIHRPDRAILDRDGVGSVRCDCR